MASFNISFIGEVTFPEVFRLISKLNLQMSEPYAKHIFNASFLKVFWSNISPFDLIQIYFRIWPQMDFLTRNNSLNSVLNLHKGITIDKII